MKKVVKHGILLALAVVFALGCALFIKPGQVYAGDGMGDVIKGYNTYNGEKTFYVGDRAYVTMSSLKDEFGSTFPADFEAGKVACKWYIGDSTVNSSYDSGSQEFYVIIKPEYYGKNIRFATEQLKGDTYFNRMTDKAYLVSTTIDISINSSGTATITGKITGSSNTFKNVRIDSAGYFGDTVGGKSSFSVTYDTKKLSIGYHELGATLSDGSICNYTKVFPTAIYEKTKIKQSWFESEKNYFTMTATGFSTGTYDEIRIDYKKGANGKWSEGWGPFKPNSAGKVDKLSANTTYYVRAYYRKVVSYNGKNYAFTGPKSAAVAIKTGPSKKPAIKSIKISKAKAKKVWVKPYYEGIVLVHKGYYVWETTYKVTINFKKKPGVAGIQLYAGGVTLPKYLKGNKKTYSTKITVTGKAVGKKTNFKIRTKGNATYGAWSPYYKSKKIKIKK